MWRTPDGDRALTPEEWALFRLGLGLAWDAVEAVCDSAHPLAQTGVGAFDVLQSGQKLAVLAEVGKALSDPEVLPPRHTAANEAALAAVLAMLRDHLALELDDLGPEPPGDPCEFRRLILNAIGDSVGREAPLPDPSDDDPEEWGWLLEEFEDRLLWDADYEMGDAFLDLPAEAAEAHLGQHGIDREYFTDVPPDPDEAGLAAARRVLAELVG